MLGDLYSGVWTRDSGEDDEGILDLDRRCRDRLSDIVRSELPPSLALERRRDELASLGNDVKPVLRVALTAEARHLRSAIQQTHYICHELLKPIGAQRGDR